MVACQGALLHLRGILSSFPACGFVSL